MVSLSYSNNMSLQISFAAFIKIMKIDSFASALVLALLFSPVFCSADTRIFDENFDNAPPYSEGARLPEGFKLIHYGGWNAGNNETGTTNISHAVSLSPPHSLALSTGDSGGTALVIGRFGRDGAAAFNPHEAITLKFAFNINNPKAILNVKIRETKTQEGGETIVGFVKLNPVSGEVSAIFGGATKRLGVVVPDRWYYLELAMPAPQAGSKSEYTVNLYEEDGATVIASAAGLLANPATGNPYSFFQIANYKTPGTTAYIDNVTVRIPDMAQP